MAVNQFRQKITISPDVISEKVQLGETLLMDVKTLAYFGLDSLGSTIWMEMQNCDDADELFEKVSASSQLPAIKIEAKFRQILQGLAGSRLISLSPH